MPPPAALERSQPAALQMPPLAWGDATPVLEVPPPLDMSPPALQMPPPRWGDVTTSPGDATSSPENVTSSPGDDVTRTQRCHHQSERCCLHQAWRCQQCREKCHQQGRKTSPPLEMPPAALGTMPPGHGDVTIPADATTTGDATTGVGSRPQLPPRPHPSHIIVLSMRGCPDPHSLLGPPQPTRGQRCPHPCPHPLMLC